MFNNLEKILKESGTSVAYLYPIMGNPYYAEFLGVRNNDYWFKMGDGMVVVKSDEHPAYQQKFNEFVVNPNTIQRWRPAPEKKTIEE